MDTARRTILGLALLGSTLACGSNETAQTTGAAPAESPAEARTETSQTNTTPEIEWVQLRPSAPIQGDRLSAHAEFSDAGGDAVDLFYEWRVNGVRAAETGPSFPIDGFSRGTTIEVQVVARDGKSQSRPARATVTVGNRPPTVASIVLEPSESITAGDNLAASPRGSDPDGDEIEFEFTWWVDGEAIRDVGSVLPAGRFERGDVIELSVVATDGSGESEELRSAPIEVVNAIPHFTSTPGVLESDGAFRYQAAVEDRDGDRRFRYQLLEGPQGMSIDATSGSLSWEPQSNQAGAYAVEIEVDDMAGGKATQAFEIRLDFEPAPAKPAP